MTKLSIVDRTKLNMSSVSVLIAGGAMMETDMLMQLFTGFGVGRMMRADDLAAVTDAIEGDEPDLVVLDLKLGEAATTDLASRLRRRPSDLRMTPVILVAANPAASTVAKARDAGVNYVVAKPMTPRTMFERLVWIVKDQRRFIDADTYVGPDRRFRSIGPPLGMTGRRSDDLPPEIGAASSPNMSQADIDAMLMPARKVK